MRVARYQDRRNARLPRNCCACVEKHSATPPAPEPESSAVWYSARARYCVAAAHAAAAGSPGWYSASQHAETSAVWYSARAPLTPPPALAPRSGTARASTQRDTAWPLLTPPALAPRSGTARASTQRGTA